MISYLSRTPNDHILNYVEKRKGFNSIHWVGPKEFELNKKNSKINKDCTTRLYNNELAKCRERFKPSSTSAAFYYQTSANNKRQSFDNQVFNKNANQAASFNINNVKNLSEPKYSNYFKEKDSKRDKDTYLLGKEVDEISSYKYNYFLTKKPKTSILGSRNLANFRTANKTPNMGNIINKKNINYSIDDNTYKENCNDPNNPLFSNTVNLGDLVDLNNPNNKNNKQVFGDYNKLKKLNEKGEVGFNSTTNYGFGYVNNMKNASVSYNNSTHNNFNNYSNNLNQDEHIEINNEDYNKRERLDSIHSNPPMNMSSKNIREPNNREDIENSNTLNNDYYIPSKKHNIMNSSIKENGHILPNLNNYSQNNYNSNGNFNKTSYVNSNKNKLNINEIPIPYKNPNNKNNNVFRSSNANYNKEFRATKSPSIFFKNTPTNLNNKALNGVNGISETNYNSNNNSKTKYIHLTDYYDGVNKSILTKTALSTKNKDKKGYLNINKTKISDAFNKNIDDKVSLAIVDNYLKRKEIFG